MAENNKIHRLSILALSILITHTSVQATGLDDLQQLMDEMESNGELHLLSIAEEETTIATRNKLNADYVPGIITIMRGELLQARGASSVIEALAFVPGIEQSHDRVGTQVALVRGIGGSYGSGKIKIMLNGVTFNSALAALANPVLLMPIEQVERIEVIRGPGSAIYGEHAFAGVINVITRHDAQAVYLRANANKTTVGGSLSSGDGHQRPRVTLNFAGWEKEDSQTMAGNDVIYNLSIEQDHVSNAPGYINDEGNYRSALLSIDYQNTSFKSQLIRDGHGDYFGTFNVLPDEHEDIALKNDHYSMDLQHKIDFTNQLSTQLNLGWQRYDNLYDLSLVPPGYIYYTIPSVVDLTYPNGYSQKGFYRERRLYSGMEINWSGWKKHNILIGAYVNDTKVRDAWLESNVDENDQITTLPQTQRFTGDLNWIDEDKSRAIRSLLLQDEYSHNEKTNFTLGLRYDHYDDVGESFSPRLAAVYRLSDEHILKAQYAHAFRPPTFFEQWKSTEATIEPETIDTYELAYIYRQWNQVHRITLFHSQLHELIISEGLISYGNIHDARLNGVELETEHHLNSKTKLSANISYSDTKNNTTNQPFSGAATWLSNVGIILEPSSDLTLSVDYRYVGERARQDIDPRTPLEGYQTLDLTLSKRWLDIPDLALQLGVKNLLDEEVRYPSDMVEDGTSPTGAMVVSYENDYPQIGRTVWINVSYNH